MKTAFKLLLLLGISIYLVFAFTHFSRQGNKTPCEGIDVIISDSLHAGFITADEAVRILRNRNAYPVGKNMCNIQSQEIEKILKRHPFIQDVVCYKTPASRLSVIISQRLPLLRIVSDTGENYYIDEQGFAMEPSGYAANLAVATGHISKDFAKTHLTIIGRYLREHAFWDDQVEQIYVTPDAKIDIVPRVGDHIIHIGTVDSIQKKFRNLMAFYQKVLPEVGWNKYSSIDIQHVGQIVCIKKRPRS